MVRDLKRILMAIATGVIIYVIIGHFLVESMWIEDPNLTPSITMLIHQNGSLNYTFTIVGVTLNNLIWGDFLVDVSPDPISILAPDDTDLISSGDEVIINFSREVGTVVSLVYEPSGGVAYQLILTPLA